MHTVHAICIRKPLCHLRSLALLVSIVSTVCAAPPPQPSPPKRYEPLSRDPAPVAIEGLTISRLVSGLRPVGVRTIQNSSYCPYSCTYMTSFGNKNYTGVTTLESFTGKEDCVEVNFQIAGFPENLWGNRESLSLAIKEVPSLATNLCSNETDKAEFKQLIENALTKVGYSKTGILQPSGATYSEQFLLFRNLHVHLYNYYKAPAAGVNMRITAATRRNWSDVTGKFSVDATYLSRDARKVRLVKADGSEIAVPLAKLGPEEHRIIDGLRTHRPQVEEAGIQKAPSPAKIASADKQGSPRQPGAAADSSKRQRRDSRGKWVNQTYSSTVLRLNGAEWIDVDRSGKTTLHYKETASTKEYVELFSPERNYTIRIMAANRMEIKKNAQGKWEWVANGRWVNP